MAETNAPPTCEEIIAVRYDIETYLIEDRGLADYAGFALAKFKRDIDRKRGYKWSQVFDITNDQYFVGADGEARNLASIRQDLLSALVVAFVFRDYSLNLVEDVDNQWRNNYMEYMSQYDDGVADAKLDVDLDESGAITDDEERTSGQKFFSK